MSTETTAPAETTPERCTDCGQERGPEAVWAVVTDTYGVPAACCRRCAAERVVPRCRLACRRRYSEGHPACWGPETGWAYWNPENGWEWCQDEPLPDFVDGSWRVLCPRCIELPARELLNVFK